MDRELRKIGIGFKFDRSDARIRGLVEDVDLRDEIALQGNGRNHWYGTAEGYGFGDARGYGDGKGNSEHWKSYPFELIQFWNER